MGRSVLTVSQYETDLTMFFKFLLCKKTGVPPTGENMENMLLSCVDEKFITSVTTVDVYEFLRYVTDVRKNKANARARKLCAIRAFYKFLINSARICESNPAEAIGTPKIPQRLPKYLTIDESLSLLSAITSDKESKTVPRDFAMIVIFLNSGVRLSELVGLSIGDIDRDLTSMRVVGKGNKERLVYLNDACRDALRDYLAYRSMMPTVKDRSALFLSLRGDRISNKTVQFVVKKYLNLAGLEYKRFSTHKLRHTAATLMYQSGKVDVRVLKDILGHEQLNTTQIYTHTSDAQMQDAMKNNPLSSVKKKK